MSGSSPPIRWANWSSPRPKRVATAGFSETAVWSGLPGKCGNPLNADGTANASFNACYPPAVNYSPRYYLVNGVSFDRTSIASSTAQILAAPATATSGNVILRLVNAGLRMHIPAVVNQSMTLIAEDGNPLPGQPRIQNEVFMAAGKTYDVEVKPAQTAGAYSAVAPARLLSRPMTEPPRSNCVVTCAPTLARPPPSSRS